MQYDVEDTPDQVSMMGSILCKAELEGIPDVTITLAFGKNVENFTLHPCVHAADLSSSRKLIFSPPADQISLCDYHIRGVDMYPLRGYYQMKVSFPPENRLSLPSSSCLFLLHHVSPE